MMFGLRGLDQEVLVVTRIHGFVSHGKILWPLNLAYEEFIVDLIQ
jgi:hypothetical protein